MHDLCPTLLDELGERQVEVVERALVDVVELTVRQRSPDLIRLGLGEEAVALLALAPELGQLLLLQQLRLASQLLVLLVQLDEDRHLRAQDLGVEGLEDVVDRTRRVTPEHLLLVLRDRGDEDDRHVARAFALLDQRRRVEAVELGHLHVEQDHGDLVPQQLPQRILAGMRVDEVLAERLQDGLEGEQVLGAVVH